MNLRHCIVSRYNYDTYAARAFAAWKKLTFNFVHYNSEKGIFLYPFFSTETIIDNNKRVKNIQLDTLIELLHYYYYYCYFILFSCVILSYQFVLSSNNITDNIKFYYFEWFFNCSSLYVPAYVLAYVPRQVRIIDKIFGLFLYYLLVC